MHQKLLYTLFYIFIFANSCLSEDKQKIGLVEITNRSLLIEVEIADNYFLRKKGLMFRKKLEEKKGMLFLFSSESNHSIWMKNTYISLDIIFINKEKYIASLIKDVPPNNEKIYSSKEKVKYILEINAGMIDNYNLKIGDRLKIDY